MDYLNSSSIIMTVFLLGYLVIIYEIYTRVSKAATAIFVAATSWLTLFIAHSNVEVNEQLLEYLSDISQIIFFLLAAMTMVEVIDAHKGFNTLNSYLKTRSKPTLLIISSFIAFLLSSVLDNLTTMILMISILKKLIPDKKQRLTPLCLSVIAANSGGAFSPIGDVTTTMLWINEKIDSLNVISKVFLPSLVSLLIPLGIYLMMERGYYPEVEKEDSKKEPGSILVLIVGVLSLLAVPLLKAFAGLPPFMGILLGLAVVWFLTDIFHYRKEDRQHLKITAALTRIDTSGILFFLGILLSVDALGAAGLLEKLAVFLSDNFSDYVSIASTIGILSAIVDNVPIVAATMGMFDLPMNDPFWLLVAFTAGTGGSILLIGSAAGVALMGIEKIDFLEYTKRASLPAFLGYLGGIMVYLLQNFGG